MEGEILLKISFLIYSLGPGGAEKIVSYLLNHFSNKYEIFLVLMNSTIFYKIPENIKIFYLEDSNPYEHGLKKFFKLPFLAYKYSKFCMQHNIDISLSFMTRPNYINALSKKFKNRAKIIINERAMPSLQHKKGIQGKINRILIKKIYKYADKILSNSKGNKFDLEKNFNLKVDDFIYNFIDLNYIYHKSKEILENFKKDRFIFITIGRIDEGKNHKLIIDALKNLNFDFYFYIIGDGPLKNFLQNYVKRIKIEDKIFFLGRQYNPYKFLSKADCFVFSSNYEGFPNAILEALACGLPVISTDCRSGPREILAPDTDFRYEADKIELAEYGILVPVGDAFKFAEAMKLIYENKKLRDNYKKKAIKRAEDFDIGKIIKKWEEILNLD